jgi:lysophospholipase L1-like esterase
MKQHHRKLSNFVLIVISLIAVLLFGEVAIRTLWPQNLKPFPYDPTGLRIYDSRYGFVHKREFDDLWFKGSRVRINSIGLRDREYGSKLKNEIRILSLGDSYSFGFGVEAAQAYPKLIEQRLQKSFPDLVVSVVNAGVSGYNTHHSILEFERLHDQFQMDFVLATFVAGNDVAENAIFKDQVEQKLNSPVGFWGRNSHLVRMVLRATWPIMFFFDNRNQVNVEYTIELLQELERRIQMAGLDYLMILIPARHQLRPDDHWGVSLLTKIGFSDFVFRQNEMVKKHFKGDMVPFIDMLPTLSERDKTEPVSFADDSHTNPLGHSIIADRVVDQIYQRVAEIAATKRQDLRATNSENFPHAKSLYND